MENELRVATRADAENIANKLKQYFPESAIVYGTIKALTVYERMWDLLGTQLYYSEHSSLVVGTPSFLEQEDVQSLYFFWDKEEEEDEKIVRLLSSIPSIDWTRPLLITLTNVSLLQKVESFVVSGLLGSSSLKPGKVDLHHMYVMASPPNREIKLPEGFESRDLTGEHARFIWDNWQNQHLLSLESFTNMLRTLPGSGIFRTTDNANESEIVKVGEGSLTSSDPVAWTQLSFNNTHMHTYTLPQYRRRGLSAVATLALAMKSVDKTGVAVSCIAPENEASIKLHVKVGFIRTCDIGLQPYTL